MSNVRLSLGEGESKVLRWAKTVTDQDLTIRADVTGQATASVELPVEVEAKQDILAIAPIRDNDVWTPGQTGYMQFRITNISSDTVATNPVMTVRIHEPYLIASTTKASTGSMKLLCVMNENVATIALQRSINPNSYVDVTVTADVTRDWSYVYADIEVPAEIEADESNATSCVFHAYLSDMV